MTFQQKFLIVVLLSTAVALALAIRISSTGPRHTVAVGRERGVFVSLAVMAVALLLVGIVSGTLFRHVIQITPLGLALVVGSRRSSLSVAAALPLFTFWLFVMGGIWLFLLGIAPVFTGRYSPIEISLTVIIGFASLSGIVAAFREGTALSLAPRVGVVLFFAILQPWAMILSF
jgi:hypothetical protein